MTLVQIVPSLPPAVEGVGGHATALGRALAAGGLDSCFLVGDPGWRAADGIPGVAAGGVAVSERSAGALARDLARLRPAAVLLHYVNYAYAPRGCPSWLVAGVARWHAEHRRPLVTYFHEVYASGPPWRSSFWTSPAQRRLAARLLRESDGACTSLVLYKEILERWRPWPEVEAMPVFSTVGEPAAVPPAADRSPRTMVVFGGAGNRRRAYGELRAVLAAACRGLGIAEIVDLGPPLAGLPADLDGLPVRQLGVLPAAAVSAVLLRAYAGFLGYPAPFLAKSTVYAAYCSHGLVPVCAWQRRRREPAVERPPSWDPGSQPAPGDPGGLAARARAWYEDHCLARQAGRFQVLLAGRGAPPS
jgi:hypothetical protein